MSEAIFGESIYSVGVAVQEGDDEDEAEERTAPPVAANTNTVARPTSAGIPVRHEAVLYCDICRRWGTADTTHICWRNWRVRLSDLLLDIASDARR